MATGSITTLGLGSGLELQDILDQLKEADRASITAKETEKTVLQEKIDAYNSINAKLFNVKSNALSLSLESDFLKTSISVTDEEIVSATADDGIAATSFELNVTQKARYNSWQSVGVESKSSVIYTEPDSGITGPNEVVTSSEQTYDILYGPADDQQTISVTIDSGKTLSEIAETINASEANTDEEGTQLVRASVEKNSNDEYYIRLSAVAGGDAVDEQVSLAGFDYIKSDTTSKIARADGEDPMYISLPPGSTYTETVDLINNSADNPGVTAALIDTGDETAPYRLTLTSDDTGEKARITIENLPLTEVTGAGESLNSEFTINGVAYQRQSNSAISDVISGVTLNLKKTGETSVGVQKDTEAIKENIQDLVENFNLLVQSIKGESSDTEDETDETDNVLENDYTASGVLSRLRNLFTTSIDVSSAYKTFADIGLEINRDGTLTLDEEELDKALAADPEAVTSFFIGDSDGNVTGMGELINDAITEMVSSSGVVTTEIDQFEARMERLDTQIETATEQLDKQYETLADSFVRLDTYIRQLNAEADYMQSMIDSFNNTTNS